MGGASVKRFRKKFFVILHKNFQLKKPGHWLEAEIAPAPS
jgi:hypothetical protein